MMPIMMAIELEVPCIGRPYSPAFLGWFPVICHSFARDEVRYYLMDIRVF